MQLVYSLEEPPKSFSKSIFLAGPTPRSPEIKSWRPEALRLLEEKGYDGVVFIPENRDKSTAEYDYGVHPSWEHRMLDMSDLILFWVPRDLTRVSFHEMKMPAFTTNVEFGLYADSGKVLFGPPSGLKNNYLNFVAEKFNIPRYEKLEDIADKALEILGSGARREEGERNIPLYLWRTSSFQSWYQSQKKAGNKLDSSKVYWQFMIGKNKDRVFYWVIHPNIFISSEKRNKINETVLSRFDIASAVLYRRRPRIEDCEIVLVREFRSPARTDDGFIWELPGGSSPDTEDPLETISAEVFEEIGLRLENSRFRQISSRQMAGTMSAHHGMLYAAELTEYEINYLKKQRDIPHGADLDNPTGERAYTEVLTLKEIIDKNLTDWANIGMILSVVR